MRFPKKTREALHASEGKPVEIPWPDDGTPPAPGNKYTVQASHRAAETRILVLFTDETSKGWRVIARVDDDPVRLLGKSGGYVSAASGAMATRRPPEPAPMGGPQFRSEYEPEAVSEADQRALEEKAATERRARIAADIAQIEAAIKVAEENPDLTGSLRFNLGLLRKQKARKLDLTPAGEGSA